MFICNYRSQLLFWLNCKKRMKKSAFSSLPWRFENTGWRFHPERYWILAQIWFLASNHFAVRNNISCELCSWSSPFAIRINTIEKKRSSSSCIKQWEYLQKCCIKNHIYQSNVAAAHIIGFCLKMQIYRTTCVTYWHSLLSTSDWYITIFGNEKMPQQWNPHQEPLD